MSRLIASRNYFYNGNMRISADGKKEEVEIEELEYYRIMNASDDNVIINFEDETVIDGEETVAREVDLFDINTGRYRRIGFLPFNNIEYPFNAEYDLNEHMVSLFGQFEPVSVRGLTGIFYSILHDRETVIPDVISVIPCRDRMITVSREGCITIVDSALNVKNMYYAGELFLHATDVDCDREGRVLAVTTGSSIALFVDGKNVLVQSSAPDEFYITPDGRYYLATRNGYTVARDLKTGEEIHIDYPLAGKPGDYIIPLAHKGRYLLYFIRENVYSSYFSPVEVHGKTVIEKGDAFIVRRYAGEVDMPVLFEEPIDNIEAYAVQRDGEKVGILLKNGEFFVV